MSYSKTAQDRYQREKRRKFTLNYSKLDPNGKAVIDRLESVASVNDYVRRLVLADMEKSTGQ